MKSHVSLFVFVLGSSVVACSSDDSSSPSSGGAGGSAATGGQNSGGFGNFGTGGSATGGVGVSGGSGGVSGTSGASGSGGNLDAGADSASGGASGASGSGGAASGGTGGASGGTGGVASGGTGGVMSDAGAAKFVFVTSKSFPANFAAAGDAAALGAAQCKQLADAVAKTKGKTWHAWLSSGLTDAITGIAGVSGGWQRTDAALVFSSVAEIAAGNSPKSAISLDETGANVGAASVWTGTDKFGKKQNGQHCAAWSTTVTFGISGQASSVTSKWTDNTLDSCSGSARLYCFEK